MEDQRKKRKTKKEKKRRKEAGFRARDGIGPSCGFFYFIYFIFLRLNLIN